MRVTLRTAQLDRDNLWVLLGLLGGAPLDWAGLRLRDVHDDLAFTLGEAVMGEMERRKAPDAEAAGDLTLDLPVGGLDTTTQQLERALVLMVGWLNARAFGLTDEPDLQPLAGLLEDLALSLCRECERRAEADAALATFCQSGGDVVE